MSNKQINRKLKAIEKTLARLGKIEEIGAERNDRNKSSYIWYTDKHKDIERIKLEIGSSVRPHPYSKKELQSYIQSYLEGIDENGAIKEFQLRKIDVNVLSIERTFVDKLMSIKRHALCGTLHEKVRHIYDVVKLSEMNEIIDFLEDKRELKEIFHITKQTDSIYLEKRKISKEYNPEGPYGFERWKERFSNEIKVNYEDLHNTLLYTDSKQDWLKVEKVFSKISKIIVEIGE